MDLIDRLSSKDSFLAKNFEEGQIKNILNILTGDSATSLQFDDLIINSLEAKFRFETFERLKKNLNVSSGSVRKISTQVLICMIQSFRKHIWNERCNRMAIWKKDHNISQRMKTTPSLHRPSRTDRSDITLHQNISPEILDDPFIPPSLKPPIEHKMIKFARIWDFAKSKIEDTIGRLIQWNWNFTGSKGTYMKLDYLDLNRKKQPCLV